jgi:hypothetical protein
LIGLEVADPRFGEDYRCGIGQGFGGVRTFKVKGGSSRLHGSTAPDLDEATDGQPRRWCIPTFVRGASDEALQYAVDCNWVMRGEGNNACLTDEGRNLITKDFN